MVERRLAQALLEDAAGVQGVIGNDGVEHAHASLVEDAKNGLVAPQLGSQPLTEPGTLRGQLHILQRPCVRRVMRHPAGAQPLPQPVPEKGVRKILAPKARVPHARLGQRTIQVQHADQPRPLAAPVRHRQDRSAMSGQPGQHMMGILPYRLGHHQRRLRIERPKHLHSLALRRNKPMTFLFLERVRPHHPTPLRLERPAQRPLHGLLRRPAGLVGG
jgi:hypothetical protein